MLKNGVMNSKVNLPKLTLEKSPNKLQTSFQIHKQSGGLERMTTIVKVHGDG